MHEIEENSLTIMGPLSFVPTKCLLISPLNDHLATLVNTWVYGCLPAVVDWFGEEVGLVVREVDLVHAAAQGAPAPSHLPVQVRRAHPLNKQYKLVHIFFIYAFNAHVT